MKPESANLIPIPLAERWRELRMRGLPVLAFLAAVGTVAWLWRDHVAAPTLAGQAEPVVADVSSPKAGVLSELTVTRFQKVRAGEPVGQVMVAEPRLIEASLAVIRAEIDLQRATLKPIVMQQRGAVDYSRLQLDWMKERAALASAQVSLQLSRTELGRTRELFKAKIVSQQEVDVAVAACERWQAQVEELTHLVAEINRHFGSLQPTNCPEITSVSNQPLERDIALQEAKLRLVEAELSPVILRAPIDGIVANLVHRTGEAVMAGQAILGIATLSPVRIVGYLRPPLPVEPQVGMSVAVRTRGLRREVGRAEIVEVGTQFEGIPIALSGPVKLPNADLGLPLSISLPPDLALRPGELVDIMLDREAGVPEAPALTRLAKTQRR